MTPPVFGLRPARAARLRASKLPKPVICTLTPFFSSPAMMPLSSNRASIVREASALDIFVRIASAAVSSALFTAVSLWGAGVREKALRLRPYRGGREKTPIKPALLWGVPRESARYLHFLDPLPP